MPSEKYRVPLGARVKPSQIGHYNFWYPSEKHEYVSSDSFICEKVEWQGSANWQAILVTAEQAKAYRSPIKVLWVEKNLFKDMVMAPRIRSRLKERGNENER